MDFILANVLAMRLTLIKPDLVKFYVFTAETARIKWFVQFCYCRRQLWFMYCAMNFKPWSLLMLMNLWIYNVYNYTSNGISCRGKKFFLRDLLHPTLCTHFHTVSGTPPIPLNPTPPHKTHFLHCQFVEHLHHHHYHPPICTQEKAKLEMLCYKSVRTTTSISWGWTKSCEGPIVKVASHTYISFPK